MKESSDRNVKKSIPLRKSLSVQLSAVAILLAATVAAATLLISNHIYTVKINKHYYEKAEQAAETGAFYIEPDVLRYIRDIVTTEEFREVRDRAEAAKDETILLEWMQSVPALNEWEGYEDRTLLDEYENFSIVMQVGQVDPEVTTPYILFRDDDGSTVIADYRLGTFGAGLKKEEAEAIRLQKGNIKLPATINQDPVNGWVCTAYEPILDPYSDEVLALYCVDISMEVIVQERKWFLLNCFILILLVSAASAVILVLLNRRIVSSPVRELSGATNAFCSEDRMYTKEDIMELPIKSKDEIGDLYHDFRDMEGRIIDYSQLLLRITAEKERLLGQLQVAARLKLNLIPGSFPAFPGENRIDLYADLIPLEKIGGDYYDFFRLDEDHVAVVIADIFNGGPVSALFMVAFKVVLMQFSKYGLSPSETIYAVNNRLFRENEDDLTLSCWFGVISLSTGKVCAVNAGHETPLLIDAEGVRKLPSDLPVWIIGMMEGLPFSQYEFTLLPGQLLFLYTDGAVRRTDSTGTAFGEERLMECLKGAKKPVEAVEAAEAALDSYAGDAERTEDMSFLCLELRTEAEDD